MNGITGAVRKISEGRGSRLSPVWGKSLFSLMGLMVLCMGVWGPPPALGLDTSQRTALIEALPKGDIFENEGTMYAWLPTLEAEMIIHPKADTASQEAPFRDMIERKGPFAIFSRSVEEEPAFHAVTVSTDKTTTYPVVLNLRTKTFAVLTGKLLLKLKDLEEASSMADAFGLTLSFTNAAMSMAFYDIPPGVNIRSLRDALSKDERVVRVTLDMVDRVPKPR